MEEVHSPTANISSPPPMPMIATWKLGENLALSHLSVLPELPQTKADDYKLQELQYAMHLDSSMLTYTPDPGLLKGGDPRQAANRFDDSRVVKRKIFVNKEVLGRLVSVAEELNKAQAHIEIRKMLKREHKRMRAEQQQPPPPGQSGEADSAMVAELLAGLEPEGQAEEEAAGPSYPGTVGKRAAARMAKRAPAAYRMAQVRCPAVLASMAPKDRWGYFRAMQRLMPAANTGRPGHIAFGSTAPQLASERPRPRVGSAAAVKAAKQLEREVERQAEAAEANMTECGEEDGQGSAATGAGGLGGASSGPGGPLSELDATVHAAMRANQVREARRAAARQLAEDEGLPTETWWDIMQKRKKLVYFKKLLEEMSGRMDLIKLHRAARVIQKAWRAHRRSRTRNASEEIALLQKQLAHRKAMEVALRTAAEAAIVDQQERAKKRAARLAARIAAMNAMQQAAAQQLQAAQQQQQQQQQASQSGASDHGGKAGGNGTFSRATSSKNIGWQHSLRGSMHSSVSHSVSVSASRAASARRLEVTADAGAEISGDNPAYFLAQNNLWSKIQALIGTDWDVDGDEDDEDSEDNGEDEDYDSEDEDEDEDGGAGSEDEGARRLRQRRERNAARKARKAAEDAAAEEESEKKKKKKKGWAPSGQGALPKATMLVKVVKQALMAAKVMQDEDEKKGDGKRQRRKNRRGGGGVAANDPAMSMRMLTAAAAALNMTVEAYVAMRNRKMGVTALQPWQPPPFPLLLEADGKPVALDEHELREMEEEARRELLEKAAMEFVAAATAAAAPSCSTTVSGSVPGRAGSMASAVASVAASGDTSSIMTWGSAAAVALAGGEAMLDNQSASEAAAAFAAAAAPSLTIPEDDVWALVKEKLRLRMAARAGAAIGGASSRGRDGGATSTAGATAASFRGSFFDTDSPPGSDYEDSEYASDDDDDDDSYECDNDETRQRRRRRRRRRGGVAATDSMRSRGRGSRQGLGSRRHGGRRSSDSGYETMSEEEIRGAGCTGLLRIQRQKERSRQELQAYYMDRRRAKKAAAAAAAASLRAERVAARAARREALARLHRGQDAGPAWRPGGGGAVQRGVAAAVGGKSTAETAEASSSQMRFWRPPQPWRPRRSLRGAAVGDPGNETLASGIDEGGIRTQAPLKPPLIRLGPYNLSPGGPSLLYREPKRRNRDKQTSDRKAGVRAHTWLKGAHVPGAVFTQYGWVPARPHSTGNGRTLQLQNLADPDLLPALEAYVRQLGIPREGLGLPKNSLDSNGIHHKATNVVGGHLPLAHARMQPLMVNGLSGMTRANSPGAGASRPPPAPDSVAAILGAASAGFFVGHAPIMPHPPGSQPPSVVSRTSLPSAVSVPTRGSAPQRTAATSTAGGRAPSSGGLGSWEEDTTAMDRSASPGPFIQLIPYGDGGDGLGISAVLGRAVGSGTASAASSSRSLLTRARFNVDVHDRPGTSGGGFVGRSSMASRRSMSPVAEEERLPGSNLLMGSAMSLESRAVGSGGGSFRSGAASRWARSASTASAAAAAAAMGSTDENNNDSGPSSMEDALTESPQDPPPPPPPQQQEEQEEQEDDNGTALLGEPFQVAVAVLRSKSIQPGVAERVFPLGLAHINDPTSTVAPQLHDAENFDVDMTGDGNGPVSYPLEDISPSSSSDSSESDADADGWATASDVSDGARTQTEPANGGAGADGPVTEVEGGKAGAALGSSPVQPAESMAPPTSVKPVALPGKTEHSQLRWLRQDATATRKVSRPNASSVNVGAKAGHSVHRVWQGRKQSPPLAYPGSRACAAGDASAAAATDEGPVQDDDGERQFDLLYDMTRWSVARPSTPTDYRVEDEHIAITLRRSKEAKQRDADEARERRRARVLAAYGGAAGASMYGGNAYERVLFRRRHARALAALAASQSPLAQLLRAVAFDRKVEGKALMPQHAGRGADAGADAAADAGVAAASGGGGYSSSAMPGGDFPQPRRGAGGGRRRPFVTRGVVYDTASSGIIWVPSSRGKMNMRVRPGGGCTSGFGNSYYWRQPVRLASLINIRPASEAQFSSTGKEGSSGAAYREANGRKATSTRSMNERLAAVPAPPPEVTEMTNTALKLLSDLGSEIGRMEEEIQALQMQAEREKQLQQDVARQSGVGGAAGPSIHVAEGQAFGSPSPMPMPMPTQHSPSGSIYRTQYLTFQQQHLQPQAQPAQQPIPQRPASRSRMTQPPVPRLTLMTLDPPSGIQGTPVPRLQYSQRPVSPSQLRASQGRQAIGVINGTVANSPNTTAATTGAAGNRHAAAIAGGSIPPHSAATFRGPAGTGASRAAAEQPGAAGSGDVDVVAASGSNSPTNNTHSHSAPLLHLVRPPSPNGTALISPNFQKLSSVGSASGSSDLVLLDAIMPPGPPLGAPQAGVSNAGPGTARRNVPNPALVPTPHNTLSGNAGWPSSCVTTLSGVAPTGAEATPLPPLPPSPIAAWPSPRRSINGGTDVGITVGVNVSWDLQSPNAVAAPAAAAATGSGPAAGVSSQVPPAHLARIGVHPYPRNNSPPTLLPSIGTAAAGPPARPSSDGQAYSISAVSRLGSQPFAMQGVSAATVMTAGAAAVTKTSPPQRMSSAGHEVAAPPSPPLAAWAATSSPTGILPEISQPTPSPKLNLSGQHTMRTSMSYSLSGSLASSGAASSAAAVVGIRASTPQMGTTRAGPVTSTSPPHSPLRNYPRMELGLGAGSSPYRIRRGSSNSPSAVYYQYSVGGTGGGGGQQVIVNDGNESGTAFPGVTVESLLLNVALFGHGGRGGGNGSRGLGDRAAAVLRTSMVAAPPTRRPRASETSIPTPMPPPLATATAAGAIATTTTDIPAASSGRLGRVRRLSIGPLPEEVGSGSGSATAMMLS